MPVRVLICLSTTMMFSMRNVVSIEIAMQATSCPIKDVPIWCISTCPLSFVIVGFWVSVWVMSARKSVIDLSAVIVFCLCRCDLLLLAEAIE